MATKNELEPFTRISPEEAKEMLNNGAVIIDVREQHEYDTGHVPNASLIPVNSVYKRREELPKDKDVIFICAVGQRSALAAEMAAAAGLTRLFNVEGGTEAWIKAGQPVER
ncbi:MAG TPA: rhodanese-like domain-containing protein [Dehalococcoidia bacterium]|jgi:rhodanese-related sulfurtransferase|nr:rhodanese-like domain-containing protein [Dehalococcoidia bacterium]